MRIAAGLAFEAPVGPKERAWAELLRDGTFGTRTLSEDPSSWQVSAGWVEAVRRSTASHGPTWLHHLHLAVALLEAERDAEAAAACRASLAERPSWHAHRLLALIAERADDVDGAEWCYGEAWALANENVDLAVELSGFLARHGRGDALGRFIATLPSHAREHERIDLATASSALARGDFERVRAVLEREFATIREGETTLSDLWIGLHEAEERARLGRPLSDEDRSALRVRQPVPARLDFRVRWLVDG